MKRLPHRLHPHRDAGDEVREEIRFYLEERARELEAQGMAPEEARSAAREAFGDPDAVAARVRRDDARHRRSEGRRTMMDGLTKDLALAVRGLARRPAFTGVLVLTLGLGIGAVTAVFSVVNASLLSALPFQDAERLVFLQGAFDAPEGPQVRGASPAEARDWETMSRSFEEVAAFSGVPYTVTGTEGDAERVSAETVDEGYLEILGATPLLGRGFTPEEHVPGSGRAVAVVGEDLWTRRWGRDPSLVGRSVYLDGSPFTVVGILPRSFGGVGLVTDVWVPVASVLNERAMASRGDRWAGVVARLADGVTVEEAQRDMDMVAARLEEAHPETNRDRIALVTPMREVFMGSTRSLVLILFGATGLLLLIAAANVANLLLVRAWARGPEIHMRRALGAGRAVLARQFLVESLVLSAAGALAGLLLGIWAAELLADSMPAALLPPYVRVAPDARVFGLVVAAMGTVGVLTGLAPALLGARGDVTGGLRERGPGGGAGSGRSRLQGLLVAGEVALALLLLVGAGLMARSLRAQLAVDPGFDHERLLAATLILPRERYPDDAARTAVMDELMARLAREPGVAEATFSADAPLRGGTSAAYLWTGEGGGAEERIRFYFHRVRPGWFEAVGVPVARGRALQPSDAEGFDVAVISRSMAERHFGGEDPVGRTLVVGQPDGDRITIVGVADDVRWRDLTTDLVSGPTDPDVYVAWAGLTSFRVELLLRSEGDPGALANAVRRAVRDVDPALVPYDVAPMADVLRTQTAQGRFGSLLLGAFSVLAAVLAAVGLYGVLSFTVGRRTFEIAVRMALGADGGDVRRMVLADGLKLSAAGLVVGLGASLLIARSLEAFLFGVRPVDPPTYAAVAALMAAVAALAAWVPALRATRVDPQRALSGE